MFVYVYLFIGAFNKSWTPERRKIAQYFIPKCSLKTLSSLTISIFRVNQLLINFGIPSDHTSFRHKQCNKFDASSDLIYSWHHYALSDKKKTSLLSTIYCTHFLICVPSSFVGKIYTHQRSGHIPGVRFCKYLLVNLLTGRHVCFSYFAFIFSPLPVSITLSNIFTLDSVLTWVIWSVWI